MTAYLVHKKGMRSAYCLTKKKNRTFRFGLELLARFVYIRARECARIMVSLRRAVASNSPPDCCI